MRSRPAMAAGAGGAARAAAWARRLAVAAAALAAGCASERPQVDAPFEHRVVIGEVTAGTVRLSCGWTCAGTWRAARAQLRGLHENKVWRDLALAVVRIGHGSDLAYYYLGRAAEELGSAKAADAYYRLSMASDARCDGWVFNSCDGIELPAAARAGLARVEGR